MSSSTGIGNFYKPITRLKSHQCLVTGHVFICLNCTHLPVSWEAAHCQELKCGPLSKFFSMVVPPRKAEQRISLPAQVGFARKRLLCNVVKRGKNCLPHGESQGFLCTALPGCFGCSWARHSAVIGDSLHHFCCQRSSRCFKSSWFNTALLISLSHVASMLCLIKIAPVKEGAAAHTLTCTHACLESRGICISCI